MQRLEWSKQGLKQIGRDPLDVAFAVRSALFESLWPVHAGQRREVMEEFEALDVPITWVVGTVIVIVGVVDFSQVSRIGKIMWIYSEPNGRQLSIWRYDILSKTRPL